MSRPRAATSVATSTSTSPRLERLERLQPLVLRLVAVQRVGAQAVALERARQPGAAELGVDEHQRLRDRALLQQLAARRAACRRRRRCRSAARRWSRWRSAAPPRPAPGPAGSSRPGGGSRARRSPRTAASGAASAGRQDALQVGQEADVEHAVGLVEHDVLDLVEHAVLRLDVVEQPARRGDQHLDALLQLERLRLHVDAAEDHRDAQLRVRGVALDVVGDLVGELARRRDAPARAPGGAPATCWRSRAAASCAAAAARTRRSCRCRSGPRPSRRGRPGRSGSPWPGSASSSCSPGRRRRAAAWGRAERVSKRAGGRGQSFAAHGESGDVHASVITRCDYRLLAMRSRLPARPRVTTRHSQRGALKRTMRQYSAT